MSDLTIPSDGSEMSDLTLRESDVYAETPELHERIDRIGFWLVGGATVMFFFSFVFAYFYLRSLDSNGLWRPAGVDPPTAYGILIAAALALSALAFLYAARVARQRGRGWGLPSGVALLLGLFACVAQAVEYAHIPFGPQSGGYASVFFGWTVFYVVIALISLYRVEVAFAAALRARGEEDGAVPEGLTPAAVYWAFVAGLGVLSWIILYLV
ncbi:MAG: cytochrome c oxidase subunit 3 [Actinobacteria bacterium]|nr:cytochrome c oxidase subunit 3 [Actinomycetota bacterium]